AALVAARRWYGEWFAPYPYRELRLSEFPGLATYAQGPPNYISFSEGIGFLTKSEPKADAAFWITAHESAHQWWPCLALPGDRPLIYDRGGWAFWMLHRLIGREASLAGLREYLATYRDSRDHPLIEEYLAVMRKHAPDPVAFDAYVKQWFLGTVVPQYLI